MWLTRWRHVTPGAKEQLKIHFEASIGELPFIFINAGKKGLLARLYPQDLIKVLDAAPVNWLSDKGIGVSRHFIMRG